MVRPVLLVLLAVPALALALAGPALAGPQVPDIPRSDLPEAGTCAPIQARSLTWVVVGELGFYRIDNDARDVGGDVLRDHLKARAKAAVDAGLNHEVWILVSRRRTWQHVVEVLRLCAATGVFRVGLQVRAEGSDALYGFPLFLPIGPSDTVPPAGTGRRLPVVMQVVESDASSLTRLYAAARSAVEHFAPVVAELSIPPDASVHDAVRSIDLLYRAGCVGVRMPSRMGARSTRNAGPVRLFVDGAVLPAEALPVQIPPVRPRKVPWPDSGAAQPGAFGLILEPLPGGEGEAAATVRPLPLPSYAESGGEVPPEALKASAEAVRDWASRLGPWLRRVLQPGRTEFPAGLLVKRRRQGRGVDELFADARKAFPAAEEVEVSTLRVQAFLFRGADAVGRIDVTVGTTGEALGVVFGSWVPGTYPPGAHLPPRETDPYAAGVPGHLRVWVEGLLAAGRARGVGAVPLTSVADVLAQLPPVAHGGIRRALEGRQASLENLVGWLRATPYDRVFVATVEGSAAVHQEGRIAGVLRFLIEAEGGGLRLSTMTPRAAPR